MAMRVDVGTSGFSYTAWRGRFYPKKHPSDGMLAFYAGHFGAVEINSTYYRLPTPRALAPWLLEVPRGFRFSFKAPGQITHMRRLLRCRAPLNRFLKAIEGFQRQKGPVLFQLPPNFKADVPRLEAFLALLPPKLLATFEFRHPSWFDDATYECLKTHQVALCIADSETLATPRVATAPWGYLRLRREDYTARQLSAWARWVKGQRFRHVSVFFKHEDQARGTRFAKTFLRCIG